MKAPEKIYIDVSLDSAWGMSKRSYDNEVEYTRTDAFIEKACDGIKHLLNGYIIRNFNFGDSYEIDTLIEDFKKYLEKQQ
jgi:hypothetical protein